MGVAWQYHRGGHFGQEIHTQLLEMVAGSWSGSRLMYLECWEENLVGLAFWTRMGYSRLGKPFPRKKPSGKGTAQLVRMFKDRYAINPSATPASPPTRRR